MSSVKNVIVLGSKASGRQERLINALNVRADIMKPNSGIKFVAWNRDDLAIPEAILVLSSENLSELDIVQQWFAELEPALVDAIMCFWLAASPQQLVPPTAFEDFAIYRWFDPESGTRLDDLPVDKTIHFWQGVDDLLRDLLNYDHEQYPLFSGTTQSDRPVVFLNDPVPGLEQEHQAIRRYLKAHNCIVKPAAEQIHDTAASRLATREILKEADLIVQVARHHKGDSPSTAMTALMQVWEFIREECIERSRDELSAPLKRMVWCPPTDEESAGLPAYLVPSDSNLQEVPPQLIIGPLEDLLRAVNQQIQTLKGIQIE